MSKFGQICKYVEYQTTIDLLDNLVSTTLDIYTILFRGGLFN
ncbi:14570_t:CDS:1, partial [Racocetra persica]